MLKLSLFGRPQKHIAKYLFIAFMVCLFFFISMAAYGWTLAQPVSIKADKTVFIKINPGMTARDIGQALKSQGLIRNLFIFQIAAKIEGLDNSLKAGEYSLNSGMSVNEIIFIISQGKSTYQQFTIPEGYTVEQIAKLLAEKNIAKAERFKELAQNYVPYPYITPNPLMKYKVEGFLFPDTYQVASGVTEEQLLVMMVKQFDSKFTTAMRQRANELELSTNEVIILASLVEKEVLLPEEQAIIAGVFKNRLKLNMPLQSCATIQYILGYPKPELSIEDTKIESPYNTYQHFGLPPGPIASPGSAAIEAVLENKDTEYLYFVADRHGKHYFSRSYEEHLAKIEQIEADNLNDEKRP